MTATLKELQDQLSAKRAELADIFAKSVTTVDGQHRYNLDTTQLEDVKARNAEIDDLANQADLTNLDPKHPDGAGYWQSGVDAYNQDAQVSECPYVAGPEADDWIRGWLSAGKDDQGQERSQDNGKAVSLDDL